ncbi:unnamed protein product [Protopolystoma xenopodis]|uniref:Uncharacterized protein n=1 Tax=Protopolystoma xenopodis TaxID=117903 RepID=A0A448XMX6_9PLAT|nr:unnamed protein product [Protopolystoma xenopodis]
MKKTSQGIDFTCLFDEFVSWRETFEHVSSPLSDAGNHDNYNGIRLRTRCVLHSLPDHKTKLQQRGQPPSSRKSCPRDPVTASQPAGLDTLRPTVDVTRSDRVDSSPPLGAPADSV